MKARINHLLISLLILILLGPPISAQVSNVKKSGQAVRVLSPPRIDGQLDDECWKSSELFTDFRQYEPYSGEISRLRTVVRIVYDDDGIYVGAMNYDNYPDSIRTQLGPRDGDRNIIADYFNVDIGPYNDGINGYSFKITASGVQSDIRRSSGAGGRDLNWDAVWHSSVQIADSGWVAEFKIPFSAIRFPKDGIDAWGVNFWRYVQRYGEWSSWNFADKSHGTSINYLGEISGITAVTPPVRLSVTPYVSGHIEHSSENNSWNRAFNGGADLKVGLSEAFTLDATLIPDFKQVQSDDQVLNLSPYEVKYNERRQFFTEGTDVFNKGGIFYSRRIGSSPSGYSDIYSQLENDETVLSNPTETRLINATKISGRTEKGLGIGFFNGLTAKAEAIIENTISQEEREIETQPPSNYNMLVFDQNLGGGSYVSLVNTNVIRKGANTGLNHTANVTATDFRYLSPEKTFSVNGIIAISQKYYSDMDNIFGNSITLSGGKSGGAFRAYHTFRSISNEYDPNDMGFLRRNNEFNNTFTLGYNIYKPIGQVLNSLNSLSFEHRMLHTPRRFSSFGITFKSTTTFKNLWTLNLGSEITPVKAKDFYEPRVDNRFYLRPASSSFSLSITSDNRKIFSAKLSADYEVFKSEQFMNRYSLLYSPTLVINNNFIVNHSFRYSRFKGDFGYAGFASDSILFGKRDAVTMENIFTVSYILSARSYIDFRARHYWSKADYNSYYYLEPDGTLEGIVSNLNRDVNRNYFNIDMSYSWRFAPGSELTVVWKNSIYQSSSVIYNTFDENIGALLDSPSLNSLSLKIIYYLDYHTISRSR